MFEGIRLRAGRLYRPHEHLARLRGSARATALDLPYDDHTLLAGIADTAAANGLEDAHVRVVVTRGVGLPGVDPSRCPRATTLILVYPFPPLLGTGAATLIATSGPAELRPRAPRSRGDVAVGDRPLGRRSAVDAPLVLPVR